MSQKNTASSIFRILAVASGFFLLQQGQALACSTNAWHKTEGNAVTAKEAAVYEGQCGLQLDLNSSSSGLVEDATPGAVSPAVTEYVARFYAYFDNAQLGNNQEFMLFRALNSSSGEIFSLKAKGGPNGPVLYLEDTGTGKTTEDLLISTGWRAITVHWNTAGNGELELIVDREQDDMARAVSGLSNAGQEIASVQLGKISNAAGISGIVDIDSFVSRRTGTSGLTISKACNGTVENITFLSDTITFCRETSGTLRFGDRVTFDPGARVEVTAQSVAMGPGMSVPSDAILDISIQ